MDFVGGMPGRWMLLRGEEGVGWEWGGGELELEEGGGCCCVALLLLLMVDGFWG